MVGAITGKDVLRHPLTIVKGWGLRSYLRCLRAGLSGGSPSTFLAVLYEAPAQDGSNLLGTDERLLRRAGLEAERNRSARKERHMGVRIGVVPFPTRHGRWELAENATMRLPRGRFAVAARVERGTVLVTQEGDLEDHVLEPGDELVLRSGGLAVAWALTDAALSVRAPVRTLESADDDPAAAA